MVWSENVRDISMQPYLRVGDLNSSGGACGMTDTTGITDTTDPGSYKVRIDHIAEEIGDDVRVKILDSSKLMIFHM
jgi:hypothetical protein